jgi:CRP-like cAMP-binding protein/class 3 adenylate cyclase
MLLTDIEGASALWERDEAAMSVFLGQHDQIVRGVIARHSGHVVHSSGDRVMAVFDRSGDGLDAAVALQSAIHDIARGDLGEPRVRIVLHTGSVEWRGGDLYGSSVNQAARLIEVARGGQIVASEATIQAAGTDPSRAYSVHDLGFVSLRNLRHPLHVFSVMPQGAAPEAASPGAGAGVAGGMVRAAGAERTALLAKVPVFAGLPEDERERLGSLLRSRRYTRGEVIFLEGDQGTALCLIAEGRIRIQLTGSDGREVVISVYGPGEIVGELALLDGEPRSADAIAQDALRVYWLQREDFAAFLDNHPRAAMTMLASLSRRLRHTTRVVQDATFNDVPARLARVLLDLAAGNGQASDNGVRIELRLTQGELAAMVGASRETVNRALRAFEQRGLIGWEASRIIINQPEQLRARAEGA